MQVILDPVTQAKIEEFGRRRRRLILVRGLCAVLTILLVAMSAVAVLDWAVLLPDEVRYGLSGLAYLLAFAAAWLTCARLIWRTPDARELARFFEQVRPDLREDLLSAVELGDARRRVEAWESEEFHGLLQSDVARRIREVQVGALLSYARIRRWIIASSAVLGACLVLIAVPGLRYDHQLLRSLLPMANLERLSRVQVTILEPADPHEGPVPQGDPVVVRVKTEGPETKSAVLETFREGKKTERVEMRLLGNRTFESAVGVARESVEYRIRAGDAVTRKYLLTAVPRPEAVAFGKTYTYPAYARKPGRTEAEGPHGDLEELEGTVVGLRIRVNQPVRVAELRLEQGGKASVIPLVGQADPGFYLAKVPLTASGFYKVHLEGLEKGFEKSGFTNKYSPQYEIRARADLVPRVVLEAPSPQQVLVVPPNEVIQLRGTAKDDLGLAQVLQMVRVNQGEWKELPFEEKEFGVQYAVSRRWDLFDLGIHPGDRVITKLVAVDLKGSRAESAPLQIEITAPGFDPKRLLPLASKEAVYAALVALRDSVRSVEKRVTEAMARTASEELQRSQALLTAASDAEKVAQEAEQVEERIKDALRLARAGREGDDLSRAARIVRRLMEESIQGGRTEVARAAAVADPEISKANLERARLAFQKAAEQASQAEEAWRDLLATEEAVAILNDLRDLVREEAAIHAQAQAAAAAKDPKTWERLARRQRVASSQAETVEGVFNVLTQRARDDHAKRAQKIGQDLKESLAALRKALEAPPAAALQGPSAQLQQRVEQAHNALHGLENELARRAEKARENLARVSAPSAADVAATAAEIDALAEAERRREEARAQNSDAARMERRHKQVKDQSDRADHRWKAARAQLEARAGVEESRRDSDPFFVADSGLASRALQAVLDRHAAAPDPKAARETLRIVEKAYRTLETGHGVMDLSLALRELAEAERWPTMVGSAAANAATRNPKDFRWMDDRVKTLPEELQAAGLPVEAARGLHKSWFGAAGDAVRREMAERQNPGRKPGPAAQNLDRLSGEVGKALTLVQPAMDEARKALQKLVPSLQERLAQLAKAAERLKEQSAALADKAPQEEAAKTRPEAQKLLENQQALDRQVEEVTAELRRDANVQDLFTEQGRERARDSDDAVAMLKEAPPKAEEALAAAAAAPQAKPQEQALDKAAEQQGKLAEALKSIAEHYDNLAKAKPEETRPELRKAEEALGIKAQLDPQYKQMEKLAQLAQQSSAEALKEALKEEAAKNEALQRQLEKLTQDALDRAEQALNQAAQMEQQAAQNLQNQSQQQQQGKQGLAEQAKKIAEKARQMAQKDVPQLAKEAQQAKANAQPSLDQAKQNLEEGAAAVPQDASNPQKSGEKMEAAAKELQQAAQDLQGAQQASQKAAEKARQDAAAEQQQAQAAEAKSQQEGQQAQAAQAAAMQAQQAADQAKAAAQQAQQAAQKDPGNAQKQQAAMAAAGKSSAANQDAQKAQAAAQAEAQEAQGAQQAAKAEGQQAQAAQQQSQAAQAAAQHAAQAQQAAKQLAQEAQGLAEAMKGQSQGAQGAMAQAAQAQQQVGEKVRAAQADITQAAQNEAASGNEKQAQALKQVAQGTEAAAKNQVAAAQQAAQGQSPSQAAQAAQAAQQAIQAQAQALAQARAQAAAAGDPPAEGAPSGLSEEASQMLAQALNSLNQPGAPGQGQAPPQASQAVQSAAQSQAQAMAQGRTPGQGQGPPGVQGQGQGGQPGQSPFSQQPGEGKGASVQAPALPPGALPVSVMLKPGEWGKLPPRLARDLMESQRESVSGEYRSMVETYFRVIAEKAREKK